MFFINILINIFLFLIIYQLYLEISKTYLIEGLDNPNPNLNNESINNNSNYKDYGNSDSATNALILSQQNAGNISFLKQRVDELESLKSQVKDLTELVNTMSTQIDQLTEQQATYAAIIAGSSPVEISGTN